MTFDVITSCHSLLFFLLFSSVCRLWLCSLWKENINAVSSLGKVFFPKKDLSYCNILLLSINIHPYKHTQKVVFLSHNTEYFTFLSISWDLTHVRNLYRNLNGKDSAWFGLSDNWFIRHFLRFGNEKRKVC